MPCAPPIISPISSIVSPSVERGFVSRPSFKTAKLSDTSSNSSRSWEITTTAAPSPARSRIDCRIEAAAAASLARAEKAAGTTIRVTDSFRSYEQQADCHRRKPTLCAAPGGSCHEKGRAIDVVDMKNQRIIDALTAEGWQRFDPGREPWHWSYQVRG